MIGRRDYDQLIRELATCLPDGWNLTQDALFGTNNKTEIVACLFYVLGPDGRKHGTSPPRELEVRDWTDHLKSAAVAVICARVAAGLDSYEPADPCVVIDLKEESRTPSEKTWDDLVRGTPAYQFRRWF